MCLKHKKLISVKGIVLEAIKRFGLYIGEHICIINKYADKTRMR